MPAQSASTFDVVEATIDGIHAAMRSGALTGTQLVQSYLDRIAAYDQTGPKLNAVQNVNPRALHEAADLDARFKASGQIEIASLHPGVAGRTRLRPTSCRPPTGRPCSKNSRPGAPARSSIGCDRPVRSSWAKTTLGEFAAGGSGSAFGDCRNAVLNPAYYASGSSCGTGVGIAANCGAVGIGEDTAGSIRGPASHGSVAGLRPTFGLVSRFGVMPQGPSRDTVGPITRTVRDAALVPEAIAGYDPEGYPFTAASFRRIPESYTAFLQPNGFSGMRLGVIRQPMDKNTDIDAPDVKEVLGAMVDRAVSDLRARRARTSSIRSKFPICPGCSKAAALNPALMK